MRAVGVVVLAWCVMACARCVGLGRVRLRWCTTGSGAAQRLGAMGGDGNGFGLWYSIVIRSVQTVPRKTLSRWRVTCIIS